MAVEEMTPVGKGVGLTREFNVNPHISGFNLTQLGVGMSTMCKRTINNSLCSAQVTNSSPFVRLVFTTVKCAN